MKQRLVGAKKGYNLLKKKSEALMMRFRAVMEKIRKNKIGLTDLFRKTYFSLVDAKYYANDISYAVVERVKRAGTKCRMKLDNVAGVVLPVFEPTIQEGT